MRQILGKGESLLWIHLPVRRFNVEGMGTHADALVACDRGVRQAEVDFAAGNETVNPFPPGATMQRAGWTGRMRTLVCHRDHGSHVCCQEHRQHRSPVRRSYRGFSYCAQCRDTVRPLLEAARQAASDPILVVS